MDIPEIKPPICAHQATPPRETEAVIDTAPLKNCITNQKPKTTKAGNSMIGHINQRGIIVTTLASGNVII